MSSKIDSDLGRFKDIINKRVKRDIEKFVSSDNLISQQNGKLIKIPLKHIDLPRFTYGSKDGGAGMGDGDVGDPMGGKGKDKKPGPGEAGEDHADNEFSAEFTPEELAAIVMEHLELPLLEPKSKGDATFEKNKYNKISINGPESLRHNKRTFKEALKRGISSGTYNPNDPKIIPIKDDKRFKSYSVKPEENVNAVVFFVMDISGSMGQEQVHLVKSTCFWVNTILQASYKKIANVFIIHDTEAEEVDKENFFKASSSGGTKISSSFELMADIIQKRYPYSENNNYSFIFGDGDNFRADNEVCAAILKEKLIPNCNMVSFGQVRSEYGSGDFLPFLKENFSTNDKVNLAQINGPNDIFPAIKTFFKNNK